jgi:CBS domain-containing protein
MATDSSATPLIAIEAVVLDTETTGLDPAKARLLELAAVAISGGRVAADASFRSLVQPGEAIPAEATAVHGIDAHALASARPFAEAWPEFSAFCASRVLIGHSIGFDLAVLANECARVAIDWNPSRTLDVRLLAELAQPRLAGYSLDQLAAWLKITPEGRHSALGDALTAAHIFLALVPHLRERGIRTLAEAERACRGLNEALAVRHRAGWADPVAPLGRDRDAAPQRFDTYPFRHRVADLMSPPQFCAPDTTIGAAVRRMIRERISSLFVAREEADGAPAPRPQDTAIVTERDVLRAIGEYGSAALFLPFGRIASAPLRTIPAGALVYRAIAHLRRLKVRHLGVEDDDGRLCGAISARDLLRLRDEQAIWLGDEIDAAADVPALARAWAKLPPVVERLIAEGASGRDAAEIVSFELEALTRRAAIIGEQRMQAQGGGGPPCAYAVAVLGSAGRGESLLALDQDNAIVFLDGTPGGAEDRWFEALGVQLADILHEVGVPYCKGGVMAKNPQWRGSLATWRERVGDWIRRSDPQDLLSVDIFFDLYGVHGDLRLTQTLRRDAYEMAKGDAAFAKLLAEAAGAREPGLGWFRRLRTDHGRIDLKKTGLFSVVTAARVLAIRHHIVERSTLGRLEGLKALGIGAEQNLEALGEAHGLFLDLILRQQVDDISHGLTPSNAVAVRSLSPRKRQRLREGLAAVEPLEELTRDLLFKA